MANLSTKDGNVTLPTVSICIPTFEEPAVLRKLLDSVAIQDFKDFEVIITDDSSTRDIERLVEEYRDPLPIRYTRNERRLGTPDNWNESIRLARGEYIKIMHHDDWFSREDSLSTFVNLLRCNRDSSFAFSATKNVYEDGETASTVILTRKQLQMIRDDPFDLYYTKGISIGSPSVTIFRKSVNLLFDRNIKWFVDIDFYIRLLNNNPNFVYSEEPLVCVSDIAKNRVTRTVDSVVDLSERIYVFNKIKRNKLDNLRFIDSILHRLTQYDNQAFKKVRNICRNNNLLFVYHLAALLKLRALSIRFLKRQLKSLLSHLGVWSYLKEIRRFVLNRNW